MEGDTEKFCLGCVTKLTTPFICCAECTQPPVYLCLKCFAKGVQQGKHQNSHSYEVVKNNFPVFNCDWTASEEINLLDALIEAGYGNWSDVAQQVRSHNKQQCERHYNKFYVDCANDPLPVFPDPDVCFQPAPVTFKLCEDPPRPPEGSTLQMEMAGYMAARGDFMTEYNNYAELDLRNVQFDKLDSPFEKDLKHAVIKIYRNVVKERYRRKKIIRNHGLINFHKNSSHRWKYEKHLGEKVTRTLCKLIRLMSPLSGDIYLESLLHEEELKEEVEKLVEYREQGITRLHSAAVYDRLNERREAVKHRSSVLDSVITHIKDETACRLWLQQNCPDNSTKRILIPLPSAPRKHAPPLNLCGLPGYNKLNEKERELCSTIRLVPESFLEFKRILMTEANKHGGTLRLAQARLLIKIDVNKTRKIYDFLFGDPS